MPNKLLLYILLFFNLFILSAQEDHSTSIETQRSYKINLKEKYNSDEFIYVEPEPKKEETPPTKSNNTDLSWIGNFLSFLGKTFPWILGIVALLIIIKLILSNNGFVLLEKAPKKVIEKLDLTDEEIIDSTDLNGLLRQALQQQNYRLATRYYFLLSLRALSDKKLIKLDKDKTNSDYLFEINNEQKRKQFSYISYLYDYVWYGEFALEENEFKQIEQSFNNFNKQI